jgi:hypothetical protein
MLNTWVHLAVVYDMSLNQIGFYVNGHLEVTATGSGRMQLSGSLAVGHGWTNSFERGRFFAGQIDDIRAYQGVLSDADILALANQ